MSKITIVDLEVFYCVGVTNEERAKPQRLLVTVDMNFDFSSAAISDRIEKTINYQEVARALMKFGEGHSWKLIERLASSTGKWRMRCSVISRMHSSTVVEGLTLMTCSERISLTGVCFEDLPFNATLRV